MPILLASFSSVIARCMMEWVIRGCHITNSFLVQNAACQPCFANKKSIEAHLSNDIDYLITYITD